MAKIQKFEMPEDDLFGLSHLSLPKVTALFYIAVTNEVAKRYGGEIKKIKFNTMSEEAKNYPVGFVTGDKRLIFTVFLEKIGKTGVVSFSLATTKLYGAKEFLNEILSSVCERDKVNSELIFIRDGKLTGFVFVDFILQDGIYDINHD